MFVVVVVRMAAVFLPLGRQACAAARHIAGIVAGSSEPLKPVLTCSRGCGVFRGVWSEALISA